MPVAVSFCPVSAVFQYFTDTGVILAGGKINTYVAGSSTPTATYTDSTGVTPNANPIILLSNGRLPNVQIWQPQGALIKIIVTDSNDVQLGPVFDQIGGVNDPTLPGSLSNPASGSGADLVANAVRSYDLFSSMRSANVPNLATGQTLEIVVQGGVTLGDTLSGLFRWSASSTATDDSLNVIKPTALSGPGRYLRQTPIVVVPTGTLTLGSGAVNVDVYALAGSPVAPATVNLTISTGVVISALGGANPALDFRGFASGSTINVTNLGYVLGQGGDGGSGGQAADQGSGTGLLGLSGGFAGLPGGNAIEGPGGGVTFSITNASGFIWGGGGGGGGGGASTNGGSPGVGNGGGGGGGAGSSLGGRGGTQENVSGLGGFHGTDGTGGTSGRNAAFGTGGAGNGSNGGGGAGGAGGTYGAAGTAGTANSTGSQVSNPGGAGSAGKAISLNGGTATFVSGSGSPNVKGAVS